MHIVRQGDVGICRIHKDFSKKENVYIIMQFGTILTKYQCLGEDSDGKSPWLVLRYVNSPPTPHQALAIVDRACRLMQ